MEMAAPRPHYLVLTFPAQGHIINPALQFAKRLLRSSPGARVTFSTTLFAYKRMLKSTPPIDGLFYTAFSDGYDDGFKRGQHSHNDFFSQFNGGDLFESKGDDYVEWLDSKQASSVVYVSFGSMSVVPESQMGEILKELLESGYFFLLVIRPVENTGDEKDADTDFRKEVRAAMETKRGLVLEWCSQVEVLSHPSVGCFVTHCGWNSTSESLVHQPTNIKMVETVWKTGVRAMVGEDGVLEGRELRRCVERVMGPEGEELNRNAAKWKKLAREAAAAEGGAPLLIAFEHLWRR